MTTTPTDREFLLLPRGYIRDKVVLANFREGLRALTNPETGALFTEDEIRRATQPGSRWFIEAQAIDDYGQAQQRNALFLADQIRIERATGKWLEEYHAKLWDVPRLQPAGSTGTVRVSATAGTSIVGSTTPDDALAHKARDQAGNVYQVEATVVVAAGATTADVTMFALGTGTATNITVGTVLTWTFRDPAMAATASVIDDDFSGGRDLETDADWATRIARKVREEEGAGNDADLRQWTTEATSAIEDAFVYPCAFYANSVLVAITQRRGATAGPEARVPDALTKALATARIVPPGSPVVPAHPNVLLTGVTAEETDVKLTLQMPRGSVAGWLDARPFPAYHATAPSITAKTSSVDFTITCAGDATLPGQAALATLAGTSAPHLMLWDETRSRWEALAVSSLEDLGSNEFRVLLTSAPALMTPAVGQWVSPGTNRHATIAEAVEQHFDLLGPGELVDPDTDPRGARCVRYPDAVDEWPSELGSQLATDVAQALGGAGVSLTSASKTEPTYAADGTDGDILAGPNMLTLGQLAIYAS